MGKRFCGVYIDHIFEFIISTLQKNKNVNINSNNIIYLKRIIEKEIFQKVFKSLVYCMNVKRLDGELIGNTPEERYLYFSETEQWAYISDKQVKRAVVVGLQQREAC